MPSELINAHHINGYGQLDSDPVKVHELCGYSLKTKYVHE